MPVLEYILLKRGDSMGKYLFFDIDGTLAGKSRCITQETRRALAEARERGHRIFVCTGRSPASIVGDVTEIKFDGMIAGAGSFVILNGQYVYEHYIERETLKWVLQFLTEHEVYYTIEGRDALYRQKECGEFYFGMHRKRLAENPELARYQQALRQGEVVKDDAEFDPDTMQAAKLCIVCHDRERFWKECAPELSKEFNVVQFSKDTETAMNGEISLKSCTKGDGIRFVLRFFGAELSDSIGFGDSMNDLPMLETAAVGVAYQDAPDGLKAHASWFFEEPDRGGIAKVMRQMGLIGA